MFRHRLCAGQKISAMMRELKFLLRDKPALLWLALAFSLSIISVSLGVREVGLQKAQISELIELDKVEQEVVLAEQSDWGSVAYYTFHMTYDPPSDFAFVAMGQRDSLPWKHRIRMLALEGQIHESDAINPDFALVGRFDFAFLLSLIIPLFAILLLYDLRSGERSAGRLELLEASSGSGRRLWVERAFARIGGLAILILIPLWIGGVISGASIGVLFKASVLTLCYLGLWTVISLLFAGPNQTGARNLTLLSGIWLLICAVMPAMTSEISTRMVAVPAGGDIVLTQREAVNDAWDLPKEDTMVPFVERQPDMAAYTKLESSFEWKWYYAFQQVGDQTAESLSHAYTQGRKDRDQWAGRLSLISPAGFVQRTLERWAATDTQAALKYESDIRAFHADLRQYYYPRLFDGREYDQGDIQSRPTFHANYPNLK